MLMWSNSVPLETPRLLLRPVGPQDLDALVEVYSDDEVTRFTSNTTWKTPADAQAWLDRGLKRMAESSALELVMLEKASGRAIGLCLLFAHDEASGRAEVGYVLGRRHWRKGLMKEALSCVLDFAFIDLKLRRVEARTNPLNTVSGELLLRLGFIREGLLRQHAAIKGQIVDTYVHGLLKPEWEGARPPARSVSEG